MSLADIKALPVADWAAPDCVLLLWVTDPLLEQGDGRDPRLGLHIQDGRLLLGQAEQIDARCSYSERDFFTGLGFWTRANPELCLLATRGHPSRRSRGVRKLIVSPRREHSRKPDEAYERIEALCEGPYLELFARARRPGWDGWGNQSEGFADGAFRRGAGRRTAIRARPMPPHKSSTRIASLGMIG